MTFSLQIVNPALLQRVLSLVFYLPRCLQRPFTSRTIIQQNFALSGNSKLFVYVTEQNFINEKLEKKLSETTEQGTLTGTKIL